jgi:hypothetical protein
MLMAALLAAAGAIIASRLPKEARGFADDSRLHV